MCPSRHWTLLSRAWIAGEKYTNRLPFECFSNVFAASGKIWCPALSTNRNSPVSMKPDLSSSQAWATCAEKSRHEFQQLHSYTLYRNLIEYCIILWYIYALIGNQWMCRIFAASCTSHTFRLLCWFYCQSLCSESNRSFDTLWSFCSHSPSFARPCPVLQAHLEGLLHVFTTTSLSWCKELAEKLVARAAKDLASSAAHALPGVLTVILRVLTCASAFVCLGHAPYKPLPTNPGT